MTQTNDTQKTLRRYELYAERDPRNFALQLQLGDLYHGAGQFDSALNCFATCLEIQPGNSRALGRRGLVMISQHRFAEAEEILGGLVKGGDSDPALLHNLGLALYHQRRFAEARRCFADAAERGLCAPSNYAYLARSLHHLGEMEAAIAAAEEWEQSDPSVAAKSYLALLHLDGGDIALADRFGRQVLAEDANDIDANVAVGSAAMERQEVERARDCFAIALDRDPENGRAWLGMGLVHLYEQQTDAAVVALANAARIFPDNAGIAVTLGWAHVIMKDAPAAERAFRNALDVDRTFAESHAGLAAALALQGKTDPATAALVLARRLDRKSIGADVAESLLRAAQGNNQAAESLFAHALSKTPRQGVAPLLEQLRIYTSRRAKPAT